MRLHVCNIYVVKHGSCKDIIPNLLPGTELETAMQVPVSFSRKDVKEHLHDASKVSQLLHVITACSAVGTGRYRAIVQEED